MWCLTEAVAGVGCTASVSEMDNMMFVFHDFRSNFTYYFVILIFHYYSFTIWCLFFVFTYRYYYYIIIIITM